MTTGEYCRAVEAHLCRSNGGHLVRIAGPSFDRVCGWEARGIPLRVVFQGIDRSSERQRAKNARRPLHIDFCEADILDVFDEWRKAVGVVTVPGGAGTDRVTAAVEARRPPSLGGHLDRVIARLTGRRAGGAGPIDALLDEMVRELDAARAAARTWRGDARSTLVARLEEMDRLLVAAAWESLDAPAREAVSREADQELAPFAGRMAPDAYSRAREASIGRLVRDREHLPMVTFDA